MSNYDTDILIQNIKSLMKDKGVTQEKLAEILGMSQSNVSKALSERDKKSFTLDQVVGIAKHFDVSIDMLVGNHRTAAIATSPRVIATFLSEIIANHDADIFIYEKEEDVFEPYYDAYTNSPSCTHKTKTVKYPAIYLPGYWQVPDRAINEDTDAAISEAVQVGNDTRMQPVNMFLLHFQEIFSIFEKGDLSENTYKSVVADMLSRLRG